MTNQHALRGMANVSFYAADMDAAKKWYAEFLGIEPYFAREADGKTAYIEFRIGDFQHEFGIIDRRFSPPQAATTPGGAVLFWHVDDLEATLERLKVMGATEYEPITPRGEGFVTASVIDPFGNLLGIMTNPHYLEILKSKGS